MNLKSILKSFKLNESTISMILGAMVVVVVGVLVANYFMSVEEGLLPENGPSTEIKVPVGGTTHTVKKGEHLWGIAEFYYDSGYNWVDIAQKNNLVNPSSIEVGQDLVISDVEPRQPTVIVKEAPKPISGATYTVAKGDHLWDIAVRAFGDGYRWVGIAQENNLVNPNLIHTGNVLRLPR